EGTFVPEFLGFGPKNAPSTSSRLLEEILSCLPQPLRINTMGRIDDILIATLSLNEHLEILGLIFDRLRQLGISINAEKTKLLQAKITYMGYEVDSGGMSLKDKTLDKLRDASPPTSYTELKSFIGLLEWVKGFAEDTQFLDDLA